jgi:hypothetical protein
MRRISNRPFSFPFQHLLKTIATLMEHFHFNKLIRRQDATHSNQTSVQVCYSGTLVDLKQFDTQDWDLSATEEGATLPNQTCRQKLPRERIRLTEAIRKSAQSLTR